jgi:hypothetical protein
MVILCVYPITSCYASSLVSRAEDHEVAHMLRGLTDTKGKAGEEEVRYFLY